MVHPSVPSPALLLNTSVSLKRRTTSVLTMNDGLMNTAFFEPDDDFQAEIEHTNPPPNKPDQWESALKYLSENHPIAFRCLPCVMEIIFILFATLFVAATGAADSVNKLAGYIYYLLFCYMF
ncbi:unnamed protein product [Caenorhabditis nigoni]|uniref:Uncharacterized protein n=1 Tax=Caenorhabditis nigoni TaxID=1611254 RepID=A0A2G5VFT7_9PELO|nr:hypothetical protein B9Z55_001462 [Caenorhabditis nigoni]